MEQLTNITKIKEILSKYGFTFSKSLGQNFLINENICPRMAEYSEISDNGVIEIGPGIGVLTNELAKSAKKVVAIELDKRLIPILDETLSEYENVKVINDDILKIDLQKLIDEEFNGMNVSVCANLPYYITSPVIMKLLEDKINVKSITVMVQKEAGMRICAKLPSRDCGALTVAVRYYCNPEILFNVSAGSFIPAPKVDSCVIKLNIDKKPTINVKDEKMFFKVVKASFAQRRKTLSNSLSNGLSIPKEDIIEILIKVGIPINYRAEQLTIHNFADLTNELKQTRN